ncbi:hypothetical protein CARUB_v10011921mg [Capsella rubella]|uniref:Uncharacterized protein n=1 Tax=Capsella rubella TaxID=81985 RepID=R0I330_9BRAS|nr:hypothetical protein CARUB_v10011921mg [Capsella rubella]
MASGDDLGLSFLDLPDNFGALTDGVGNEHNDFGGLVPFSATTSDVFTSSLMENLNIDQGTLTTTPSFDQETAIVQQNQSFHQETAIVQQNQSFHQEDDYSQYFNTGASFNDMSSSVFSVGQGENVYYGNCVPTSSNTMMTNELQQQSIHLQSNGHLEQSYQQAFMSQTIPDFSTEPYLSTMVMSNIQEVENIANEPTNLNLIQHGLQDRQFHPPSYQENQLDHNGLLLEQLVRIHEKDYQMQLPKFSNMSSTPTSVGTLRNNQCLVPFASTPTNQASGNYSPFTQTSYQHDSLAYAFQKPTPAPPRRPRGRPRRYPNAVPSSVRNTTPNNMSLVPTTQTLLTPPCRPYFPQDKGKQHVTAGTSSMPSMNPTLYSQYQNSHTETLFQQSGGLRQPSFYGQFENEGSSSKRRRIMLPFQETSVAASSDITPWQDGNTTSNGASHHQERLTNTVYDPRYVGAGLPIDPHLRFF